MKQIPITPTIIRRASPQDAAAAAEVLQRSIREVCGPDYGNDPELLDPWCANKTSANLSHWISQPQHDLIVAEQSDAGQIVGRLVGVGLLDLKAGVIKLCYLVPEALSQGIGKALLQTLEQSARAHGHTQLRLESSLTARDFYLRQGYHLQGEPAPEQRIRAFPMVKLLRASDND